MKDEGQLAITIAGKTQGSLRKVVHFVMIKIPHIISEPERQILRHMLQTSLNSS
jgi:hypothetical protein